MNTSYHPADRNNVLKMRGKGYTYRAISDFLSIPTATVFYWVRTAIAQNPELSKKFKAPYRKPKTR